MCTIQRLETTFGRYTIESVPIIWYSVLTRGKGGIAGTAKTTAQGGGDMILLCIIIFPFAVLAELLRMNK